MSQVEIFHEANFREEICRGPPRCCMGRAKPFYGHSWIMWSQNQKEEHFHWGWLYPCGCVAPCTMTEYGKCEYNLFLDAGIEVTL